MGLAAITRIEFVKLLKKRISLTMLATLFVPIFYTYSVLTDAPLLQMSASGALDFSLGQWSLLGMTGLFQILFSLVSVGVFSSEIDSGQIKMSVLKQCARKRLVYAKIFALLLFMVLCYIVYIVFSLLCYYSFVIHSIYGTGEFISEGLRTIGVGRFAMSGIFPLFDALLTAGIVFLFSLRYKSGVCFMLAIGITTLLLIMQFFPGIQYLVPAYVGNLLDYGEITMSAAGLLCLLYGTIVAVCLEITAKKFERMDLK